MFALIVENVTNVNVHYLMQQRGHELVSDFTWMIGGPQGSGVETCLLYTSPSPRDRTRSRMPSSA